MTFLSLEYSLDYKYNNLFIKALLTDFELLEINDSTEISWHTTLKIKGFKVLKSTI